MAASRVAGSVEAALALTSASAVAANKAQGDEAARARSVKIPGEYSGTTLAKAVAALEPDVLARHQVPDPFPLAPIPPKVLEEDDYVESLSTIIERDYYPDLPWLRVEHAILQAKSAGDGAKVARLRDKLAAMTPATPAKRAATPATPLGTPKPSGLVPAMLMDGRQVVVDTNQRLDKFQAQYTSEDNASFEQIVRKEMKAQAEREWYMEARATVHNAEREEITALAEAGIPHRILTTKSDPRAPFLFPPKRAVLALQPKAYALDPAATTSANTRLRRGQLEDESALEAALARRRQLVELTEREREADEIAGTGVFAKAGLSTSRGSYPLVATPRVDPGDLTPMMTYGEIGSTPLCLEQEGPVYEPPEESEKERRAHVLAESAVKRLREHKRRERQAAVRPWKRTASILRATPGSRATPARSIFATPARTPASTPGRTPSRTPALSEGDRSPRRKRARHESSLPSSLTDGLL